MSRWFGRAGLVVMLGMTLFGCKESEEAPPPPSNVPKVDPDSVTRQEAERGKKACEAYADRVCACAEKLKASTNPAATEMSATCERARSLPEALQMSLDLAEAPGETTVGDKFNLRKNVRNIIAGCFADDGKLDPVLCPRTP